MHSRRVFTSSIGFSCVRDCTRAARIFSTNVKTRKPRVTRSMQRLRNHWAGWMDRSGCGSRVPAAPHRNCIAAEVIRAAPRSLILVPGPIVSYNHVGLFTFFYSSRRCRRPIASFRTSFFPSLPEVQLIFAW